jgi:hypothetical protein
VSIFFFAINPQHFSLHHPNMPPKRNTSSSTKKGKGKGKKSSPAPEAIRNLWPTGHVGAEDIERLMQSSYSCSMGDYNVNDNSVVINMAKSTGTPGIFNPKCHTFGRIPVHYQPAARFTLHQSVVYLSILMADWRADRSSEEAELVLGLRRLASYYRLVFLDLVEATAHLDGPCPPEWRWTAFDHHLQRKLSIGVHDPDLEQVQRFVYSDIDLVNYGTLLHEFPSDVILHLLR